MFSLDDVLNRLIDKFIGNRCFHLVRTGIDLLHVTRKKLGRVLDLSCIEYRYEFKSNKWYIPNICYYWYYVECLEPDGKKTCGFYPQVSLFRIASILYAHRQVIRTHLSLHYSE